MVVWAFASEAINSPPGGATRRLHTVIKCDRRLSDKRSAIPGVYVAVTVLGLGAWRRQKRNMAVTSEHFAMTQLVAITFQSANEMAYGLQTYDKRQDDTPVNK